MSHRGGGGNPITSDDDDSYPQNDDENNTESEEITYTYKTYYDYFIDNMGCTGVYDDNGNLTNVTISDEKKAEILSSDFTGSGTSTDPYQVNSSLGFWFMSKFVTFSNKYVELNCDVILNDENFDEKGNASGGDGVVYSWEPLKSVVDSSVNGHNNTIFGLYFNDCDKSIVGLFSQRLTKIENLNFKNPYVSGSDYVSALGAPYMNYVENVNVLNGYFKGSDYVAGVIAVVKEEISNCKNYATVICDYRNVGGVCGESQSIISHCKNYGKICYVSEEALITSTSFGGVVGKCHFAEYCDNYGELFVRNGYTSIGGVVGSFSEQIYHCNNYGNGDIETKTGYAGGICGSGSKNIKISFCNNYGNITTTNMFGGICGQVDNDKIIIDHCNFYGSINSASRCSGILVGTGGYITNCGVYGVLKGLNYVSLFFDGIYFDAEINNCTANCLFSASNNLFVFTQYIGSNSYNNIRINNVKINAQQENKLIVKLFGSQADNKKADINMKNVEMNFNSKKEINICVAHTLNTNVKINAKSLYIKANSENSNSSFVMYYNSEGFTADGVICELNGSTKTEKQYYGTSFRDFYLDWKTNKIGLSSLDGIGTFQGKITEEWLTNNGFVKKN